MDRHVERKLITEAKKALTAAYGRYSGISVAAAVLSSDGEIFTGVNVENASYGLTVCAERNAIFNAVGREKRSFPAMALVSDSDQINSPCGACRQVMVEFSPEMEIVVDTPSGHFYYTAGELLPASFTLE